LFLGNLNSNTGCNAQTAKHSSKTGSMKHLLCAVLLAFPVLAFYRAASAEEDLRMLDVSRLPQNGALVSDFAPLGWRIESTIPGDLNGDGKPDTILTLIEALPAIVDDVPNERYRALVALLQTATGKLQRVAVAPRLLRCSTCYGMLAGPNGGEPVIKIIKGVIIVEELWGSRETVHVTLRFRYDPSSNRLILIGEDINRSDRATGAHSYETSNFLTGIKLTEGTQFDAQQNRLTENSPQKQHIPKIQRFIEDIDYEDFDR
jgi:hypothetical protein